MSFLQLDDKFACHPKVRRLSDAAFRLHVAALCDCKAFQTDGHIAAESLDGLTPHPNKRELVERELIPAGLWERSGDGGWDIHDYLEWNYSRADIEKLHKKRKAAGHLGALAKAKQVPSKHQASAKALAEQRVLVEVLESESGSEPDQPDRSELDSEATGVHKLAHPANCNRGTRITDDWTPTAIESAHSWHEIARRRGFSAEQVQTLLEGFRDYWRGIGGQKGVKRDWEATWRNRLREAPDYAVRSRPVAKQQAAPAGEYDWYQAKLARDAEAAKKAGGG